MTEPVEANCLDCSAAVTFDNRPGYTTCKGCAGQALPDLVRPARRLPEGGLEGRRLRQGAEEKDVSIYGRRI